MPQKYHGQLLASSTSSGSLLWVLWLSLGPVLISWISSVLVLRQKSASVINKMTPRGESGTMMTLNLSIKEESKRLPRYTTLLMDCLAMTTVAAMATAVAAAGTEAVRENGYRVVEWVVIGGSQMGHPR